MSKKARREIYLEKIRLLYPFLFNFQRFEENLLVMSTNIRVEENTVGRLMNQNFRNYSRTPHKNEAIIHPVAAGAARAGARHYHSHTGHQRAGIFFFQLIKSQLLSHQRSSGLNFQFQMMFLLFLHLGIGMSARSDVRSRNGSRRFGQRGAPNGRVSRAPQDLRGPHQLEQVEGTRAAVHLRRGARTVIDGLLPAGQQPRYVRSDCEVQLLPPLAAIWPADSDAIEHWDELQFWRRARNPTAVATDL